MRSFLFYAAALICYCTASPVSLKAGRGKYIIKLRPQVNQLQFLGFVNEANRNNLGAPNKIKYRYSPRILNGFAGEFSHEFLKDAHRQYGDDIEYVEEDGTVHIVAVQHSPPSWGLSRISDRSPLNGSSRDYDYPDSAGEGVEVWVVDTGVQHTHSDFGGRAEMKKSFVNGEEATDLNGHGTHCAGTVASETYGVAKKAKVYGVKVLNRQGSGSYSDVIAGIQFVAQNVKPGKTVLSMSLGGPKSQSVDDAVVGAIREGVVCAIAAGNDGKNAKDTSPASAPGAITVGATDNTDKKAKYSNFGRVVSVYAPGSDITSLWKGANGATNTISGTSMATPHVAGLCALYMAEKDYASFGKDKIADAVRNDIIDASTLLQNEKGQGGESERRIIYVRNSPSPNKPLPPSDDPQPGPEPEKPWYCKWVPDWCEDQPFSA